ncbi:MAG: MFS transporter [Solirubrobacteraceae bacterium]
MTTENRRRWLALYVLCAGVLMGVIDATIVNVGVYTILQVSSTGWGSTTTLALGGLAVALLAAFIARQDRVANPLIPLRLFRSRQVSGANGIQALLVVGMFGMFFLGALYLQQILGYDALEVGLAFLPATIVMGAISLRFSGPLTMRFGPVATLLPGLVAIGAALLLYARTPDHASYVVDIMPAMALLGLGAGLAFPALTIVAMSGATPSDSGLASGLVNTSVNVGGALGLAVLATSATERTHGLLAGGASAASALNSGYHLAYLISAALVGVAVVVALTVLRPRRHRAAGAALGTHAPAACGETA